MFRGNREFVGVDRRFFCEALGAGFRAFTLEDHLCPLRSEDGAGALHVLMPIRVEDPEDGANTTEEPGAPAASVDKGSPDAPAASPSDDTTTPDSVDEQQKPKGIGKKVKHAMTENQDAKRGAESEPTALDRLQTAYEAARAKVREAGTAISDMATAIKEAVRDNKSQAKDLSAARATLEKLKTIEL